ncbi:hypothetical protein SAMN02799622_03524 [Methylobacterium sp. UNC378MF]|uniref:hypothetical protein n=1 Tax=Methylobacterium sp. UNC378MF TaxID=1502748 RepID=UPI0008847971|nr:hypothetical protein [Methylobacterium sp. UNC378MF]SDA24977.1 hypothetical protein SAMN02799622_03524 [Methylobacterium sp. UNC378MF]
MSEPNPALGHVLAMEHDIRTVERIGRLLMYLGERDGEIEAEVLNALVGPLIEAGRELKEQFDFACAAARGDQ